MQSNRLTGRSAPTFIEQARREQIVAGAIDVLAEVGYQGASLAAIAERIGVSKGVLSYHFVGKSDLLRQVVSTVLGQAGDFMAVRVEAAGTNLDALRMYVRANLEFLDANRAAVRALVEVLTHIPTAGGDSSLYAEAGAQAVDQLRRLLERGQEAKEFGEFDAYVAAVSIRASIDAATGLLRSDPKLDLAEYSRELVAFVERSVRR